MARTAPSGSARGGSAASWCCCCCIATSRSPASEWSTRCGMRRRPPRPPRFCRTTSRSCGAGWTTARDGGCRRTGAPTRFASSPASSTSSASSSSSARAQRRSRTTARPRPPPACARALALWRGPPLADVAYEGFAQPEIARLEEQRAVALERRIDADLALGRHADLLGELEALVSAHPLREHLRGQRMLALYRCGRQADALEAFREARRLLVEEVGVEPGPELRDAARRDPAPGRLARPRARDGCRPSSTRRPRRPLAGREREMEALRGHWERARDGIAALVVITGRAGMGKTRLAAELAGEVHRSGCAVRYADRRARPRRRSRPFAPGATRRRPTLLVVDDADRSERTLAALGDLARAPNASEPLLTIATAGAPGRGAGRRGRRRARARPAPRGRSRRDRARLRAGNADGPVPADELLERSRGVPAAVHDVAREWAREATRAGA